MLQTFMICLCCASGWLERGYNLITPPPGSILTGNVTVSAEEMLTTLAEVDVILVGEKHDDPLAHRWELFIWISLASRDRSLALEMFETDVQDLLDSYLAGEVTLDEFLEGSRPWGNYAEDYSLMVEYAALNGFQVIAANVPRHFASNVARNGWEPLEAEAFFLDISVDSSSTLYRNLFLETMGLVGDQMHDMPMDPLNMYRAQLLKDAVMAASIAGRKCVFVCGSFHSDYHSGIPDQLPEGTSFLTVKVLEEEEEYDPAMADFVVVR